MKILHIITAGFEEGGAENSVVRLQPILEAMGHQARTMASDLRMDMPRYDDYTFKAIPQTGLKRFTYHAFNPASLKLLRKVLAEYQPDIVLLHTMGEVSPSVLFALKNVPTIATVHGPEEYTPSLLMWHLSTSNFKDGSHRKKMLRPMGRVRLAYIHLVTGPLYRLGFRNVDQIVVFSHYMQKLLKKDGLTTTVVPNAIDLMKFQPALPKGRTIIYTSRLEVFKGVHNLIAAMPLIQAKEPDAKLIIVGDGSYKPELQKLTKKLKLTKSVTFIGHSSREEVEKLIAQARVIVMPSTWPEAFGKAGLEGLSVGRPAVVTDVGGVGDWMQDGKTGYVVPPNNPEALAQKILILLQNDKLWAQMSKQGRARAEEFSMELHAQRLIKVCQDTIKKAHRS